MKILVDECISPLLVQGLHRFSCDAVHLRDRGRLGEADRTVFALAVDEDRIVVTENAGDFCELAAAVDMHPGIVVLPSVARDGARRLMNDVIAYLLVRDDVRPADIMVNAVLSIDGGGQITVEPLP